MKTNTPWMGLKQAARNYLRAVESGTLEQAEQAKDQLAAVAVLWAQAEVIEQVEKATQTR